MMKAVEFKMTDVLKSKVDRITKILKDCPKGSLVDTYWGKELLKQAKSGKRFTLKVMKKSSEWPTCACGRLSPNLKRAGDGRPLDRTLSRLGTTFFTLVKGNQTEYAATILVEIEQRAVQVMRNQEAMDFREAP